MSVTVNASDVKKLREATDAPLMECRNALVEAGNDFDKAKEILREKGRSAAAKRVDRVTSAGAIAIACSEDSKTCAGVVLESETDFVARNDEFKDLVHEISNMLLDKGSAENPLAQCQEMIQDRIQAAVAKMRENIKLAKSVYLKSKGGFGTYVHHDLTKGCVVELEGDASNLEEVGRALAIQCVAYPPEYVSRDEVPQELIAKEIEIETQRALADGKNPEIAGKIAQGKVNKEFYQRVVLLDQPFYKDSDKTIKQYLEEVSKAVGSEIKVKSFIRLAVGEA